MTFLVSLQASSLVSNPRMQFEISTRYTKKNRPVGISEKMFNLFHFSHSSEPGSYQENNGARGTSVMESEQGQDYWFVINALLEIDYWWVQYVNTGNNSVLCLFFRVVHAPPGGHPGPATETRWASDPEVSQQKPGRHRRHQTYLQPHHQTQHCAGALCGHRSVNTTLSHRTHWKSIFPLLLSQTAKTEPDDAMIYVSAVV